jgi:hypothetical protein
MIRLQDLLCEWTGESWSACANWKSVRNLYQGAHESINVSTEATPTEYSVTYVGPASGVALAHAAGGAGDTLHQVFNVLICEMNPWLSGAGLRPDITHIQTACRRIDSRYELSIVVPVVSDSESWQITHRGGWGHDPGVRAVIAAAPKTPQLETATNRLRVPGAGKITTHFATYPESA